MAEGPRRDNVVAFARRAQNRVSLTLVGRFFTQLGIEPGAFAPAGRAWKDTTVRLPADWAVGEMNDALTGRRLVPSGGTVRLADVFETMPYAVLAGDAKAP